MTSPRATIRLQFNSGFTLDDATAYVPYFAELGISHIYASPLLTARRGSLHGYDVIDHNSINPELGGEPALRRLAAALREKQMGLVLDIVPNHMAVGGSDNAWWLDVLEWGRRSRYASFFDIDWHSRDAMLQGRLLAPFLGRPYTRCRDAGELLLRFDDTDGRFSVAYHEHRFPLAPESYSSLLSGHTAFAEIAVAFDQAIAASAKRGDMHHEFEHARRRLAAVARTAAGLDAMESVLQSSRPACDSGKQRLHALLQRQHYVLASWQTAADRINWRRFFDVNSLAALCVERPPVFEATHALVLRLYSEGLIDGVRIDHVDGLADPAGYCRKLHRRLEAAGRHRPADARQGPPWIVAEKILAPGETLSCRWRIAGTTGYDSMNEIGAVLHHPAGQAALGTLWHALSGRAADFDTEAHAAKRELLETTFNGEFQSAVAALAAITLEDPVSRDIAPGPLRRALAGLLVCLPAYRFYRRRSLEESDRRMLAAAVRRARHELSAADRPALRFILDLIRRPKDNNTARGTRQQRAIRRIQLLCPPLAAKSIEDTAFYRYGPLLSRNEVGASPTQFGLSLQEFHRACQARGRDFPASLVATATHDHKRGEDVRARLAVLSEIPDKWRAFVESSMIRNTTFRSGTSGGIAPTPGDELMCYQTMVGAWPPDVRPEDTAALAEFSQRVAAWQTKAVREAKLKSSWQTPSLRYEAACRKFTTSALRDRSGFVDDLHRFVQRIACAGAINSLTQTVLRMTVPGIPDLYQGTELWDFSLVDPDNRRAVDFACRLAMLDKTRSVGSMLSDWRDGKIKQHVVAHTLKVRRRYHRLMAIGSYTPLDVEGPCRDHVIAFARQDHAQRIVVIATRFPALMQLDLERPLVMPQLWRGTRIKIHGSNEATDVFSTKVHRISHGWLAVSDALRDLPVALLEVTRLIHSH